MLISFWKIKSFPKDLKVDFLMITKLILILCFTVVPHIFVRAEENEADKMSGSKIAAFSNNRYVAHDESTELWMLLINSSGQIRLRRFIRWRKNFSNHKRVLMKFFYPQDIRNTGILNVERPQEKYDTQFLYLPAVKKMRRMSSANKAQRWVGSDFLLEDIQEIKFDDWNYRRLEDDLFDKQPCYVVEWQPKKDTETVYGKEIYWYRKEGYLPVRIDYYDKKGKLWKRASMYDIRYNQGVWTAWVVKMEDFDADHTTINYRRWILYDTQLPDNYLTTRNLEKDISSYNLPSGLWDMINSYAEYDDKVRQYLE